MKISSDGGKSWPEAIEVANDASNRLMYWDQHHAVGYDQCITMFWTYDRQNNRDATIHISWSNDFGKTWTPPQDTGIVGQIAQPILLGDGRLVVIYLDRFKTRSIRARLSEDGGRTFGSEELVIYEQPGHSRDQGDQSDPTAYLQDMQLWTFGRIDAIADTSGDIWVIFYGAGENVTNIYWARIRT